jgi:RNA recognition motif-containing protein
MSKRELFVGRLPMGLEISALREMFEKFGTLTRCDLKTSRAGTYAFVAYEDIKNAETAIDELHLKDVRGSKINVEWAKSRDKARSRRYSPRYSPYSSRRRRNSRSPSPRRRDRSPRRRDDRDRRDRSPRREDRRDDRGRRDGRRDDRDRSPRRYRRSRSRSPVSSSRHHSRSRSRSPVERRESSRSPKKGDNVANGNNSPSRSPARVDRVTASPKSVNSEE